MSALAMVQELEARGGSLTLNGNKVRCRLPKDAALLLIQLRQHREGVINLLRQREAILRWLAQHCVSASAAVANTRILHRECSYWAGKPITIETFIDVLATKGFLDDHGTVRGICLGKDFLAARKYEQQ